jgi:hypothetical protein
MEAIGASDLTRHLVFYPEEIVLQTTPTVRRTLHRHRPGKKVMRFGIQEQNRPKGQDCLWVFLEADPAP